MQSNELPPKRLIMLYFTDKRNVLNMFMFRSVSICRSIIIYEVFVYFVIESIIVFSSPSLYLHTLLERKGLCWDPF